MLKRSTAQLVRRAPLLLLCCTLLLVPTAGALPADQHPCSASPADQGQVIDAIRTMYAAATADDLDRFHTVASPQFYAFDGGKRYDGDALMAMVKELHASGKVFVWTVTEPEVHITCDSGWISYVNRGSMKDDAGEHPLTWLESAFLQKESGTWRIRFFHSTRVP